MKEPETPAITADSGPEESARLVDPSEAVTGFGIVFGILGALIAIAAAVYLGGSSGFAILLLYCAIAALAGASAGIVVGGTIGAVVGVVRGVIVPGINSRRA